VQALRSWLFYFLGYFIAGFHNGKKEDRFPLELANPPEDKGVREPSPHPAFMTFMETERTLVSAKKRAVLKGGESSRNQALSIEI
jgi:hypothetical protein